MEHNYHPSGSTLLGEFTPDNLIAGGFPGTTKEVILKNGVKHLRGTVLQETTTAGVYDKVTEDAKAIYVLLEDRDLTAATNAQPGMVLMTGGVNKPALILGAGATLAGIVPVLEARNLYLRDTVKVVSAG